MFGDHPEALIDPSTLTETDGKGLDAARPRNPRRGVTQLSLWTRGTSLKLTDNTMTPHASISEIPCDEGMALHLVAVSRRC